MWCIVGTLPDPDFALCPAGLEGQSTVSHGLLHLPDGQVERAHRLAALAAQPEVERQRGECCQQQDQFIAPFAFHPSGWRS